MPTANKSRAPLHGLFASELCTYLAVWRVHIRLLPAIVDDEQAGRGAAGAQHAQALCYAGSTDH